MGESLRSRVEECVSLMETVPSLWFELSFNRPWPGMMPLDLSCVGDAEQWVLVHVGHF